MALQDPVFFDEQKRIFEIKYDEELGEKITLLAAQINAGYLSIPKTIGRV